MPNHKTYSNSTPSASKERVLLLNGSNSVKYSQISFQTVFSPFSVKMLHKCSCNFCQGCYLCFIIVFFSMFVVAGTFVIYLGSTCDSDSSYACYSSSYSSSYCGRYNCILNKRNNILCGSF